MVGSGEVICDSYPSVNSYIYLISVRLVLGNVFVYPYNLRVCVCVCVRACVRVGVFLVCGMCLYA